MVVAEKSLEKSKSGGNQCEMDGCAIQSTAQSHASRCAAGAHHRPHHTWSASRCLGAFLLLGGLVLDWVDERYMFGFVLAKTHR